MAKKRKNPAAVALGKLGGRKGGRARVAAMTAEELHQWAKEAGKRGGLARAKKLSRKRIQEIAKKAAKARWSKSRLRAAAKVGPAVLTAPPGFLSL